MATTNRTIVELKHDNSPAPANSCGATNRTIVELKRRIGTNKEIFN